MKNTHSGLYEIQLVRKVFKVVAATFAAVAITVAGAMLPLGGV